MSDVVDVSMESCCANCGAESGDAVKLKNCTACRLVKYCGVDCQKAHRGQHRGACKRRAAELKAKDEQLYTQVGAGAAGGGLLPDLHIADPSALIRIRSFAA